ncbi:MAG: hypothetical protein C5B53_12760 [Candidatus Melainabacteria bacterium]|nr:MAG: hypothetical protein C5B53_12760 [Candidatus Melainabacteria bacterium]
MLANSAKNAIPMSLMIALSSLAAAYGQTGANAYFNPPTSLSGKTVVIPAGTTLEGRLDNSIGSSISKMGERFSIELTSPALANGTDVLIPAGARIVGEVVEAVPSGKVHHDKHEKPFGKLKIQITNLRMPDGTTFPMIASIVGENNLGGQGYNPDLGGGVAYAGTNSGFNMVAPGRLAPSYGRRRGPVGPHLVTKQEVMSDPILGRAGGNQQGFYGIRSLIKKKRNLFIYQGSPLTVRLDSPLKMGIGVARNAGVNLEAPPNNPDAQIYPGSGHRRFSPDSQAEPEAAPPSGEQFNPAKGIFGNPTSKSPAGATPPQADREQAKANSPATTPPLPFQVPNKGGPGPSNSQDSNF